MSSYEKRHPVADLSKTHPTHRERLLRIIRWKQGITRENRVKRRNAIRAHKNLLIDAKVEDMVRFLDLSADRKKHG